MSAKILEFGESAHPAVEVGVHSGYSSGNDGGSMPPDMNDRLSRVESKLDTLQYEITGIKGDVSGLKSEMSDLRKEVSSVRYWVLGMGISSILAMLAVVIALTQLQASWFQHSLEQREAALNATVERIERNTQANMQRMDNNLEKYWQRTQETLDKIHELEVKTGVGKSQSEK